MNSRDGSVIMGKSGRGQVIIDPSDSAQNRAYIYSSNYWNNYNYDGKPSSYSTSNMSGQGMLIILSDAYIHLANNTGKIYSGSHNELISNNIGFYLSHDGFSLLILQE